LKDSNNQTCSEKIYSAISDLGSWYTAGTWLQVQVDKVSLACLYTLQISARAN